jgi:hypothetical protein
MLDVAEPGAQILARELKLVAERLLYCDTEVEVIAHRRCLQMQIQLELPFLIEGYTRADLCNMLKVRGAFVRHLKTEKVQRRVSSFLYQQFVEFYIHFREWNFLGPANITELKRIVQKEMAGRPGRPVPSTLEHKISSEARRIHAELTKFRALAMAKQKNNLWKDSSSIADELLRRRSRWIKYFLRLNGDIPANRYESTRLDGKHESKRKVPNASRCGLSEPERWYTNRIVATILRDKYAEETGITYYLDDFHGLVSAIDPDRPHTH